jgi:hypothetical protein
LGKSSSCLFSDVDADVSFRSSIAVQTRFIFMVHTIAQRKKMEKAASGERVQVEARLNGVVM